MEPKWVTLGHPSYVWRFGQQRRLNVVRQYVKLHGQRILDVGCGIGTYVLQLRDFSPMVYGIDIDQEKVEKASQGLPNLLTAAAEALPFAGDTFGVVFLHEVIEHVIDERKTIEEAVRVTEPGGCLAIFAPNRWYPFETHGIFLGSRFVFGLIPLVNYLPSRYRRVLCPHARAYTHSDLRRLLAGLNVEMIVHTYVYPGFDNIAARHPLLANILRRVFYFLENTPLRAWGLSHFCVVKKIGSDNKCLHQQEVLAKV
jgi:SAM-dependent methyltransferase